MNGSEKGKTLDNSVRWLKKKRWVVGGGERKKRVGRAAARLASGSTHAGPCFMFLSFYWSSVVEYMWPPAVQEC
jgi:hypothetical protein